ncbi:MAG TPA: molybdopterin dinucleotide binding domain-containing protein, partial [Ilumatobacteraceae bacterium]|nr:molybdopterin dinucleotide binding domain-containing protein [Ilumatobacteraceae bacterium]
NDETGLALAHGMGFDWAPGVPSAATDDPGPREVAVQSQQFVDTFPGDSHGDKARLVDEHAGVPRYVPVSRDESAFPLTLISPATSKTVNSMFGEFQSPEPTILLHPGDAAARELTAGMQVAVSSVQGRIEVKLDVNDSVRPGVAVLSKGSWLRCYQHGRGVNMLTSASGEPTTNGACFNDTHVEVGPA